MSDVMAMAEQIREMGATEFHDANHAHESLVHMHEVIAATQEWAQQMGEKIREAPGITNDYAEVADEAASALSGISDGVQEGLGEGIVQG